jgi:hypothetical protein
MTLNVLFASPSSEAAGSYDAVTLNRKERHLVETAAELHTRFKRRSLLYNDDTLVALVDGIGRDLAPEPTDEYIQYRFFLLHDPSPNAFGLPNGDVYVHTGLLARLADRSQLAAILAHEIAHVAAHHGIFHYRATHGANTASTLLLGESVFGRDAWWMWNDMVAVGLHTSLYGFGRAMEQEADLEALEFLATHGYDPHALPEVLEILSRDLEGLNPRLPTVWNDRTGLAERALDAWAQTGHLPGIERDSGLFREILFPLRVMSIRDYLEDDYPHTALALSRSIDEAYPRRPEVQQLLGDGLRTLGPRPESAPADLSDSEKRRSAIERARMTREERYEAALATPQGQEALARNLARAIAAYELALELDREFYAAYRGLGEVHELLDSPREAAAAYLSYVKLAQNAPDRVIIIERLKALRDRLQGQEN